MNEYYIVSQRQIFKHPAQGCLNEFEDVIVDCCNGLLIETQKNNHFFFIDIPKRKTSDQQILILVVLSISLIPKCLSSIHQWRSRFDIVIAYIFDAFIPDTEYKKSIIRRKFSSYTRLISSIDYLFISMETNLNDFRNLYNIPVSMIPLACDTKQFANYQPHRLIDVMGYGRQHEKHTHILSKNYNDPKCQRVYYHTNHFYIGHINDFYQHRRFFWKMLTRSKISLAYDSLSVDPNQRFPFSFVGQRWFESITAGCLILGYKPTCPEMNKLFFWEDATIELPQEEKDLITFLESILMDSCRLASVRYRNVFYATKFHDWRHRLVEMHDCLKLPCPDKLKNSLIELNQLTKAIKQHICS